MPSYAEMMNIDIDLLDTEQLETCMKNMNLYHSRKSIAKNKAEEEFYLKQERLKIQLGFNASIPDYEYAEMERLQELQSKKKQDSSPNYCVFVTVSPQNGSFNGFEDLRSRVEKCVQKYWITEYAYCFEQRKEEILEPDNPLQGLHSHILIKKNSMTPKHIIREITSTFKSKDYVARLDFKWKKKEWIPDKIAYMQGEKTGEGKLEKTLVDKTMRQTLGIEKTIFYDDSKNWMQYENVA